MLEPKQEEDGVKVVVRAGVVDILAGGYEMWCW